LYYGRKHSLAGACFIAVEAFAGKAIGRQTGLFELKKSMASRELLKLKTVKPRAKIGIIAPSSPAHPELVDKGVKKLESLGFELISPLDPSKRFQNLGKNLASASAIDRAEAFMGLIERKDCEMILAVRGGYGSVEMLPYLDFEKIRQARKPVAGYSDVTALLSAIYRHSGIYTIHGPSLAAEFNSLIEMVQGEAVSPFLVEQMIKGEAEGRLIVGNLSIFQTLLGTDWDLSFDDSILLIEDVGEAPYRIHRILTQLKQAGKFAGLRALVCGRFSKCKAEYGPAVVDVIEEIFSSLHIPVFETDCFGHNGLNQAIPYGAWCRVTGNCLKITESPMEDS